VQALRGKGRFRWRKCDGAARPSTQPERSSVTNETRCSRQLFRNPAREQSEQLVTNQSKNAKALHSRNHNIGACPVSPPAPKPDLAAGLRLKAGRWLF
jgi:hypothetical protein